jgi:CYTH domain-containing protein/predicted ATPase
VFFENNTKKGHRMCILTNLDDNVRIIVITGGPCGGKTEALEYARRQLTDNGYRVLVIPESATKLINGGISPQDKKIGSFVFQSLLLADVVQQETIFFQAAAALAAAGERVIVLADRGAIEGEAYLGGNKELFAQTADQYGWQPGQLCEGRYHAAIHLVTAAEGAEQYYSRKNPARYETPEEARAVDALIANSWLRHPHFRMIDNSTGFRLKLIRMMREIMSVLGEPTPTETEDKYLVRVNLESFPVPVFQSRITQDYLLSDDASDSSRVRMRESPDGYVTFYQTTKRSYYGRTRLEKEKHITRSRYETLLASRDPEKATIVKIRHTFVYGSRFFELDQFFEPVQNLLLLEIERLPDENPGAVKLPPFIEVVADVSDDPRYSNRCLAKNRGIPPL